MRVSQYIFGLFIFQKLTQLKKKNVRGRESILGDLFCQRFVVNSFKFRCILPPLPHGTNDIAIYPPHRRAGSVIKGSIYIFAILYLSTDYQKFSSDYSHSVVGGTSSARGMRSASELRDLMDTLQRKKIALENSLRANGNANPSYFSVTQVGHAVTVSVFFTLLAVNH